jgi:hypothetical protein
MNGAVGARLIVVRQHVAERPHAGGKKLLDVPGYKFQALPTNSREINTRYSFIVFLPRGKESPCSDLDKLTRLRRVFLQFSRSLFV